VTLTATNACGPDTVIKIDYITVTTPAPVAEFVGSPTSGTEPLTVNFTDQSTGDISSWSWTFGDGGTSTVQNPSYQYDSAGTYTVSLTVTGPGGADTTTKTDYITVNTPPPVAEFIGNPTSGTEPLTVSFTDQSTGSISSWSWAFGDGGTSIAQNPSYQYDSAGTYTVSLTVTGPGGPDTVTKTDYVTVDPCVLPAADFVGSPTTGDYPLTVSFTDQSTNADTWAWDFGDGDTSSAQSPSHSYTAAGTYTVTLTATNACGPDTVIKHHGVHTAAGGRVRRFADVR
jgi:PKD repeat protein